jgi:hypothetical protein
VRYLGLALYAEGKTDYYFLAPLLLRLCESICSEAVEPVEFAGETIALDHRPAVNDAPRDERVLDAADQARGAWQLLFIHADGANDPVAQRARLVEPALAQLRARWGADGIGVAVVPVRETEAWVVADGDALRNVLGSTLSDDVLGLPMSPYDVEAQLDPKEVLRSAFWATGPTGQRRRRGTSPMLNALGEQIALQRLRRLPSFQLLEADLRSALRAMRILRTA